MNLRTHKRRACAGMTRRRVALLKRGPYHTYRNDASLYPRLCWLSHPGYRVARSGVRPRQLCDHFGYRPGSW